MTSINTICNKQSIAVSVYKGEELSITTKMRLEALGIDPSTVTSQAQAEILIAQAEAAQKQNNSGHQQGGGNSSHQELISEAKELAFETGANISGNDTLDEMLEKIAEKLNTLAKDPSKAQQVQSYQSRLINLANKADVTVHIQQNIFDTMDMISVSNKLILGLN